MIHTADDVVALREPEEWRLCVCARLPRPPVSLQRGEIPVVDVPEYAKGCASCATKPRDCSDLDYTVPVHAGFDSVLISGSAA